MQSKGHVVCFPGRCILLVFLAAFASAAAGASPPQSGTERIPKHILVLYDEDKDNFPGLASIDRILRESFASRLGKAVEIHSESLGLARPDRPADDAYAVEYLLGKYGGAPPYLIVAVLEPSLDFILRHAGTLFAGVPVVFVGVDAATIAGKSLPANVTGVLVKRDFSRTVDDMLRLQPETRNAYVVLGAGPFDRYLEGFVRRDLKRFEDRISIRYLVGMDMDALLRRVAQLPPDSVVLYVTVFADAKGHGIVTHEALAAIAAAANAPTYVFLDQYVGLGAVGGNVYSTDSLASHVAALGTAILDGAAPASLPTRSPEAQVDLFDARQLRRWHLDRARLPHGSAVLYDEMSVWRAYRWYIIAALGLLLVQGALIAGLLLARRRQRRAEAQALRERDDLAHVLRITTVGELASSLAHEISQPLGAIILNAGAAVRFIQGEGAGGARKDVQEALADIISSADHASRVLESARALFRKKPLQLVPVDVKALVEDVVRLLHVAMLTERIHIRFILAEAVPVLADPVQLEQVLLNVVCNACDAIGAAGDGPRTITIHAHESRPGHVAIDVVDTGSGADDDVLKAMFEKFSTTKPQGLGMGLAISRSIIDAHGGLIWATRNADRGLTLHIELVAAATTEAAAWQPASATERYGT
ncbi:MAG TPA: ATP-binding protein [Usitatibacter sp.]|jgi:signal transduction histidine kinase|nr:ATP-binding protein [Usitatibacter sp.]